MQPTHFYSDSRFRPGFDAGVVGRAATFAWTIPSLTGIAVTGRVRITGILILVIVLIGLILG